MQVLKGDEAPLLSQVKDWLENHPGWEVVSDSDDSGDDDSQDEESGGEGRMAYSNMTPIFFNISNTI